MKDLWQNIKFAFIDLRACDIMTIIVTGLFEITFVGFLLWVILVN